MADITSRNGVIRLALSQKQWEWVGKLVAITLLGFFSPTWILIKSVMDSYIDINALMRIETAKVTWMDFIQRLKDPHTHMAGELIGQLLLCLMVSLLYLYMSGKVGEMLVRWAMNRKNSASAKN